MTLILIFLCLGRLQDLGKDISGPGISGIYKIKGNVNINKIIKRGLDSRIGAEKRREKNQDRLK
jgi:hypothetical protein